MGGTSRNRTLEEMRASFGVRRDFNPALQLINARCRLTFVWLTAAKVGVGLCDLLLATALYLLFLRLQGVSPSRKIWWVPNTTLSIALITSAVVMLRALADILSTRWLLRKVQDLYVDFLSRLVRGYSEMRWSRFVERNRSDLVNHSIHAASEAANFYHYSIEMISAVAIVGFMAVVIVYKSPTAALGLGIVIIVFYSLHRLLVRQRLQGASAKREAHSRALHRTLAEMFSSGKEIRTYGNQQFFEERACQQACEVAIGNLQVAFLPLVARIVADQGVMLLFLGLVIAVQMKNGDVRQLLSLLVFYFVLSRRMLPLVSQISYMAGHMASTYQSVKIVESELRECIQCHAPTAPVRLPGADEFAIELEHVSFWYHKEVPILRDVNLSLRKREMFLIRGPSGSGKTSILNLIAGILEPSSGGVRVDRMNVAFVPQEIALLDDTIRNNLIFGLTERSDVEMMNALSVADLGNFVSTQAGGLETRIGDNGILLSGGERQRLGLARAILRDARVLLLDEATSALDEETEWRVLQNLNALGMTILIVSHRTRMRSSVQRVFRLHNGFLVEEGTAEVEMREVEIGAVAAG